MIELVSGMPAPQFGDESSLSARIRSGSRAKRYLCFVLTDVRCLRVLPGVRLSQVEDHCYRLWSCWKGGMDEVVEKRRKNMAS
jgi:hypothetical protein